MKQILIVVDMQNDFIDGALGTKEAAAIVPKVEDKIRNFDGEVFFTGRKESSGASLHSWHGRLADPERIGCFEKDRAHR